MKKGQSKGKGSSFEREVCKDLSRWMTSGDKEDLFWRSAASGGRSTIGLARGEKLSAQAGDISAVHPLGHNLISAFYVECKFYKDLQIQNLVYGAGGGLIKFWKETVRSSRVYDKHPMLIAKQNFQPIAICLNMNGANILFHNSRRTELLRIHHPDSDMRIYLFDDFKKYSNPNRLK